MVAFDLTSCTSSWLWEMLSYCPDNGVCLRASGKFTGRPTGVHQVRIGSGVCETPRVIWKMMTGENPPPMVDHWDGDDTNNRWTNLRAANYTTNGYNGKTTNKTGVRGVWYRGNGTWSTSIRVDGEVKWLGTYHTLEEAAEVRRQAEQKYHGIYAYTNRPGRVT